MSKGLKAVIIASALALIFTTTAYAASSTFLPRAQQLYDQMCKRGRASGSAAMLCYLFDKTSELQTSVNNLGNKVEGVEETTATNTDEIDEIKDIVISQSAKIEELEEKINEIIDVENSIELTFFADKLTPYVADEESQIFDLSGRRLLVLNGWWNDYANSCTSGTYLIYYSDDGLDWTKQGEIYGHSCPPSQSIRTVQKVMNVKGKYYKAVLFNTFRGTLTGFAL